jgi:hypothetical protein
MGSCWIYCLLTRQSWVVGSAPTRACGRSKGIVHWHTHPRPASRRPQRVPHLCGRLQALGSGRPGSSCWGCWPSISLNFYRALISVLYPSLASHNLQEKSIVDVSCSSPFHFPFSVPRERPGNAVWKAADFIGRILEVYSKVERRQSLITPLLSVLFPLKVKPYF